MREPVLTGLNVLPLSQQRQIVIDVKSEAGERVLSLGLTFAVEP